MIRSGHGQWKACGGRPEIAGYFTVSKHVPPDRRGTYLLFTCRSHTILVASESV